MNPKVTFFTVTHYKDYDFLLGSIEHHAEMGTHLVLDTSPLEKIEYFKRLPDSVRWVYEPYYGSGWKDFKVRSAVERAMHLAREFGPEVLVYLDSDEFLTHESVQGLFPHALDHILQIHNTHWKPDGYPYMFGASEWHTRLWPATVPMKIETNTQWQQHQAYDGNPERHPVPVGPIDVPVLRVPGGFHHHLHYVLKEKSGETQTADQTIDGWPDNGHRVPSVPWPVKLRTWYLNPEIRPSDYYR